MTKTPRLFTVLLAVAALAGSGLLRPGAPAAADTPSPTADPPTVITSVVIASPEPSMTPLPPTVTREQGTPVSTSIPIATEGPGPTPTAVQTETVHRVEANATETAIPAQSSTVPGYVPLPSPAELRLNARLRWGTRVPPAVRRWAFLIVPAAHRYGLDPNLIAAVMTMESGGDPLAWNSGSDARGLMQVLHGPWDPKQNIDTGARMLSQFYAQFHGDLTLTLAAYNAGPNAVLQYAGVPPYRETRDYVIVVGYLYDLYSHHHLTGRRQAQYRRTLKDLARFPDQRKKISRLEHAAGLSPAAMEDACQHFSVCQQSQPERLFTSLDPFWPVGQRPDPLQHVDPYTGSS